MQPWTRQPRTARSTIKRMRGGPPTEDIRRAYRILVPCNVDIFIPLGKARQDPVKNWRLGMSGRILRLDPATLTSHSWWHQVGYYSMAMVGSCHQTSSTAGLRRRKHLLFFGRPFVCANGLLFLEAWLRTTMPLFRSGFFAPESRRHWEAMCMYSW